MSAKHALLGLLLDRPAYPYQLAGRMQERLGPAWAVNSGQLYQTVKVLEKDGLIQRVDASGGEDRHVFRVTDAGVSEFERFFEHGADGVRLCRRPLLLKIAFAGPQRLREARERLDAYEAECARRLAEVSSSREQVLTDGPLLRADHLLLRLSLSADVFQLEGELRWARHAREMLTWLEGREAVWPGGRTAVDPQAELAQQQRESARRQLFGRMSSSGEDEGKPDGGEK